MHTLPAQRQDCHQDKTHGSAEQWGRAPAAGPLEARPGPAREGVGVAVRAAARLAHRQAVAADDGGRVNPVAHEHICALQQLGRDDDDGRRTVADLLVLQLGQLDQDLRAPGAAGRLLRRALRPTAGPAPPARLRCCPILSVLCQGGRPDGGGGAGAGSVRPEADGVGRARSPTPHVPATLKRLDFAGDVFCANKRPPPRSVGDAHLCGWVFHLQQPQDGRTIVGDGDVPDVINQHLGHRSASEALTGFRSPLWRKHVRLMRRQLAACLVQADWSQRALHYVCYRRHSGHILRPDVLPRRALALQLQRRPAAAQHAPAGHPLLCSSSISTLFGRLCRAAGGQSVALELPPRCPNTQVTTFAILSSLQY